MLVPDASTPAAVAPGRAPVIVLSYAYPPDGEIGGWRAFRFQKYLTRLGHPVHVISATPQRTPFVQEPNVHRLPAEIPGRTPRSWRTYLDLTLRKYLFYDAGILWVPQAASCGKRWVRQGPAPVVISTSPPIHTHFAALRLKKKCGVKWIADFRDPMTENPGRKRSRKHRFDPYFERLFIANADLVLANTSTACDFWRNRYPEHAARIHVLWNGYDPEDFTSVPPPPKRDFTLISHVGDVYSNRDPMYMLRAVERLIDRATISPSALRVAFHGMVPDAIATTQTFVRLRELGCVTQDSQSTSKAESEAIMRSSDVLLVVDFLEPLRLQVPAKVFFYVRTGRPVIACTLSGSPAEVILRQSGVPSVCLHPDDPDERVEAGVLEALALPQGPHEPTTWFIEQFDSARQIQRLSEWIESL